MITIGHTEKQKSDTLLISGIMIKEVTIYYLAVWVTIATVIKGSVIESNDLLGAETASSSALSSMSGREVIRNCGCLILTPQTSVAGR